MAFEPTKPPYSSFPAIYLITALEFFGLRVIVEFRKSKRVFVLRHVLAPRAAVRRRGRQPRHRPPQSLGVFLGKVEQLRASGLREKEHNLELGDLRERKPPLLA